MNPFFYVLCRLANTILLLQFLRLGVGFGIFFIFFIYFFGLHLCCALYPPGMGQFFFLPPTWLKQGGLFLRDLWVKVCRQVLTM